MLLPKPLGGVALGGTRDPFILCSCMRTAVSCPFKPAPWLQREKPSGW